MGARSLEEFVEAFDDFHAWPKTKQADYLAYFLTTTGGESAISASDITNAFTTLRMKEYKRISAYLSENASSRQGKYVKARGGGYCLARHMTKAIERDISQEPSKVSVSTHLAELTARVQDGSEKEFLQEALNCYRVEAYRAFIVMVWILTMDHLQRYIFANELTSFNDALAKNPDRKIAKIVNYDDFSDLRESKIIELARSGNIISKDVRKIVDEKLGTRNSAAHPAGIKISGHKATEFALDLLDNVILKYA